MPSLIFWALEEYFVILLCIQDEVKDDVVMVLTWLKETYDVDTYHNLVRNIFLNLDPRSLKRARQVCKEWDRLVMKEVWGSEEGRREMERRLDMRWREARPTRREVIGRPGYDVDIATCDDIHIAVIAVRREGWNSRLVLYNATDLSLIYDREVDPSVFIWLQMGTNVLAGVSFAYKTVYSLVG